MAETAKWPGPCSQVRLPRRGKSERDGTVIVGTAQLEARREVSRGLGDGGAALDDGGGEAKEGEGEG